MALTGKAKVDYQREYMRKRRAGLTVRPIALDPTGTDSLDPVRPTPHLQMLDPIVSVVRPTVLDPLPLDPSLIYKENNLVNNLKDVNTEGESEGKPKKKITLIDEAFILKMHERWDEKLSATEVDDQIELAQAHKSFDKWNGKQVYVNNWLKRQAEGATNGKSKQPLAFDNRIDKYREAAKTDN